MLKAEFIFILPFLLASVDRALPLLLAQFNNMFRRNRTDPIRIAVFGVTGAGKSTLIKTITGDEAIVIGNGLRSRKWAAS